MDLLDPYFISHVKIAGSNWSFILLASLFQLTNNEAYYVLDTLLGSGYKALK